MGRVFLSACLASLLLLTPPAGGVALGQKPPPSGAAKPRESPVQSTTPSNDPTQRTPAFGGSGGTAFELRCGPGYVLTGVRGRQGMLVDRIGILCRPVRSDGTLGSETTVGNEVGGGGGNPVAVSCGSGRVVSALRYFFGTYVDSVTIGCRTWHPGTKSMSGSAAFGLKLGGDGHPTPGEVRCESDRQPGAGILGRAGNVVDAIGLVCNEP